MGGFREGELAMNAYLVFGVDTDGDYFIVGLAENRPTAEQMILKHNNGNECLDWQAEPAPLYFLHNRAPLVALHCHSISYYIAELKMNEGVRKG
jgi:hypothetical protein